MKLQAKIVRLTFYFARSVYGETGHQIALCKQTDGAPVDAHAKLFGLPSFQRVRRCFGIPKPSPQAEARPDGGRAHVSNQPPRQANGQTESGCRVSILEPVHPGAVSPDRALCLPTFSHFFLIVNQNSLSTTFQVTPWTHVTEFRLPILYQL